MCIILLKNNIPLEIIYIIYTIAQIRYDSDLKIYTEQIYSNKNITLEPNTYNEDTVLRNGKYIRIPNNHINLILNDIQNIHEIYNNEWGLFIHREPNIYEISNINKNQFPQKIREYKNFIFKWYDFIKQVNYFIPSKHDMYRVLDIIYDYRNYYSNIFITNYNNSYNEIIKNYTDKEIIDSILNFCYCEYYITYRTTILNKPDCADNEFNLFFHDYKKWKQKYGGIKLIFNKTINYIPQAILSDNVCINILNKLIIARCNVNININKPKIYDIIQNEHLTTTKHNWPRNQPTLCNEYPVDSWGNHYD